MKSKLYPQPTKSVAFSVEDGVIRANNVEVNFISHDKYVNWTKLTGPDGKILFDGPTSELVEPPEDKANHDCLAKRRPGEPMFILLGRDPDAHNIVRMWAERRQAAGGDLQHCQMAFDTAARMQVYAADPANRPDSAPSGRGLRSASDDPARDHAQQRALLQLRDR